MAWAEKLPSGKYRGCWRDPAGSQHHTSRPDFPEHPYGRKRDAVEAAQEAEVQARRRAAAAKGTISASTTFGEWWETVAPHSTVSEVGRKAANIGSKYLIPQWGATPLNEIQQRDAKVWIFDLLPGREVTYVQRIWAEFRRAMNLAVEKGVLGASPCVGVKLPKARRKSKQYMDDAHLKAIRPKLHPNYAALTEVALKTGLRPAEICGLHADAVDLDTGWVEVQAVKVTHLNVIRPWPKDRDTRWVPLTDDAVRVIRGQLAGRDLTAGCGVPHTDGAKCRSVLVFRNAVDGPPNAEAWWAALQRAAAAAKVPAQTPYGCRRGFATAAARGGLDVFELAEIMGHSDVKQTRDYVQQSPAARDRLRAALGERRGLKVVGG